MRDASFIEDMGGNGKPRGYDAKTHRLNDGASAIKNHEHSFGYTKHIIA